MPNRVFYGVFSMESEYFFHELFSLDDSFFGNQTLFFTFRETFFYAVFFVSFSLESIGFCFRWCSRKSCKGSSITQWCAGGYLRSRGGPGSGRRRRPHGACWMRRILPVPYQPPPAAELHAGGLHLLDEHGARSHPILRPLLSSTDLFKL